MSPRAKARMDRWGMGQRQPAMHFFERCDLPGGRWICAPADNYAELVAKLRTLNPDFELIYDKATSTPGTMEPAFHLARVTRPGGTAEGDSLVREFSLTNEEAALIGKGLDGERVSWLDATAKAPGDWVYVRAAELLKAKLPGDEAQIERQCGDHMTGEMEKAENKTDAAEDEMLEEAADVMASGVRAARPHKPYRKGKPIHFPVTAAAKSPILRGSFDSNGNPVVVP